MTHSGRRSAGDLFRRGVIAVYLLRVLEYTGYFSSKTAGGEVMIAPCILSIIFCRHFLSCKLCADVDQHSLHAILWMIIFLI